MAARLEEGLRDTDSDWTEQHYSGLNFDIVTGASLARGITA